VSAEHPDADVLTAFSERLLPERERNSVLEHLARCGDCREIVALALPVSELAAPPVPQISRGWLTWPALRWGFVAAGFVAITSVGILQYRRKAEHPAIASYDATRSDASQPEGVAKVAKNQAPPVNGQPADEEAKVQIPSTSAVAAFGESGPATAKKQEREFDRVEAFSKLESPGTSSGARKGNAPAAFGPSVKQQMQQNNFYANNSQQGQAPPPAYAKPQPPPPAVPPAVAVPQSSNEVVATTTAAAPATADTRIGGRDEKKAQDLDTLAAENRSAPALPPSRRNAGAEVARAKPAEATANSKTPNAQLADAYSVSAANSGNFAASGALAPESSLWSINAIGGLQRSVDTGKTWQDVDVDTAPGAAYGANLSSALKSKSSREKTLAKDKADAKETPPIVFRAVSANGPDVWAGGSGGALYHSTDAGGHWMRVVPSWSEVVLTDDIVSVQFADPQRGRILTSSSEIWTTADAGQTWQKH
jgi:hypothetical protein